MKIQSSSSSSILHSTADIIVIMVPQVLILCDKAPLHKLAVVMEAALGVIELAPAPSLIVLPAADVHLLVGFLHDAVAVFLVVLELPVEDVSYIR